MIALLIMTSLVAFITNRTHVNDELGYVTERIENGENEHRLMELRVREIEFYKAESQTQIEYLSEQIDLVNQKLDRVLDRLAR